MLVSLVAATALVIGTIFTLSYWQEIRNFISRIRHGETPAAVVQPYQEPERQMGAEPAPEENKAAGVVREAPLRPAPTAPLHPHALRANDDGHRGPRVVPDIGERPSAQAGTLSDAGSGRRRHPGDYDVVGFECSKVNNNRLRCDAYLRDGRWRAVTCDRIGTGRIHSCGPFGPGHDRQEFDVRWILRNKPARTKHEPPPRPPRLVRRY
ncbi:MAG TPA: hypothetical protein PKJ97_01270 [Candidatus Bilamarchaeaceae archaeon]|nr:hypothetical protein [Candidatus Bilamarchaeaceae archaeon]